MTVAIVRGGPELIGELKPLWLAMVHHHAEVAPELGPVHDDDETWRRRSADYEQWLREDDAFVLVARERDADEAIGYALVTVNPASPTWREPERVGTVESLAVLPDRRGAGVGRALLDRVREELARIGVHETRLTVVAANAAARRFYERLGFEEAFVALRRPAG